MALSSPFPKLSSIFCPRMQKLRWAQCLLQLKKWCQFAKLWLKWDGPNLCCPFKWKTPPHRASWTRTFSHARVNLGNCDITGSIAARRKANFVLTGDQASSTGHTAAPRTIRPRTMKTISHCLQSTSIFSRGPTMVPTEDPTGSPQATPVEIFKIAFSLVSVPRIFYLDLQQGYVITWYLHV